MGITARLDDIGKPAWIGLMVLSFIIFWPLGLALLAFLIWSGRMGCWRHHDERWSGRWQDRMQRKMERLQEKMGRAPGRWYRAQSSSGNVAFDEYREETLRRLEEEQQEFRSFLDRLRHAKDKAEFDQFMADRRNNPQPPAEGDAR
jgi:hypothetical protein